MASVPVVGTIDARVIDVVDGFIAAAQAGDLDRMGGRCVEQVRAAIANADPDGLRTELAERFGGLNRDEIGYASGSRIVAPNVEQVLAIIDTELVQHEIQRFDKLTPLRRHQVIVFTVELIDGKWFVAGWD